MNWPYQSAFIKSSVPCSNNLNLFSDLDKDRLYSIVSGLHVNDSICESLIMFVINAVIIMKGNEDI